MHLQILRPGETLLDVDVRQATLPGARGELTPLPGHERMITVLRRGRVTYSRLDQPESSREGIDVEGGLAEVLPDAMTIFVNGAKATATDAPRGAAR